MAKSKKTLFICTSCSHEEPRWLGRCPHCGEWNTLKETVQRPLSPATRAGPGAKHNSLPLQAVRILESTKISTGLSELDRVLGGGLLKKSSTLISGEPGIGKSTLLLQAAAGSAAHGMVLYISGEESAEQIRLRADRLGLSGEKIELFCSGDLDAILKIIDLVKPVLIIVDSVQTLHSAELGPVPGTVNQMKYATLELISHIKERDAALVLIAHVTKDGLIAGPKALEHMVDTVLLFEHQDGEHRFLRSLKNRFGSTEELGIFSMSEKGLIPQEESGGLFLTEREGEMPSGLATAAIVEGNRVLLLEIQALTVPAKGSISRITSERIEQSRVARIAASIEKHLKLSLSDQDLYINVSGGIRIGDVGADLAIAAAIFSARTGVPNPAKVAFAGELSLSGELRPLRKLSQRIRTAEQLGFSRFISPPLQAQEASSQTQRASPQEEASKNIRHLSSRNLGEALSHLNT